MFRECPALFKRRHFAFVVLAAYLALAGCGGKGMVKVEGRVTVKGKPAPLGYVLFVPVDLNQGRAATGNLGADGRFAASSMERDDGLEPGEYHIAVFGPVGTQPPGEEWVRVPARYAAAEKSGLTVTVKKGDAAKWLELELDSK